LIENSNKNSHEDILNISLNKAENILLIFTNRNSLFRIDLHHDDDEGCSIKALDLSIIKSFHHKKIIAVDYCIIKPYMVTCDTENTIKLWNYRSGEHELSKTFNETIISVGLNNSNGLCLAISFLNKIVFYLIVQNRLKYLKTLNLSNFLLLNNS
jgi:WD40 repeat protein